MSGALATARASASSSASPFSWRTLWVSESQLVDADGVVVARMQSFPDGWRAFRVHPRRAALDVDANDREEVVDVRIADGNARLAMTGLYRDAIERSQAGEFRTPTTTTTPMLPATMRTTIVRD